MKFITDYKELNGESCVSVINHIGAEPIDKKETVLSYLKNGKSEGVRCSGIYDYVGRFSTGITIRLYTDGEYFWDSEEIYHFEKYNLELNEEFLRKVKRI